MILRSGDRCEAWVAWCQGREEAGRVKDSSEEGCGENDVAVAKNRKSEGRAGLGGREDAFESGEFRAVTAHLQSKWTWEPQTTANGKSPSVVPPQDI